MGKLPGLPPPPPNVDAATRQWMEAVSEALAVQVGQRGDPLDRAVTVRELGEANIATVTRTPTGAGITPSPDAEDKDKILTPPPAPLNLEVNATPVSVILTIDKPRVDYVAHAEFYRSDDINFDNAILIGVSPGQSFVDASVQPGTTYYYWVRFVSYADVAGPLNSLDPVASTTLDNGDSILDQITGRIDITHLDNTLSTPVQKIPGIESDLAGEIADRFLGDITLGQRVDGETANRTAAIQTEQTARVNADNVLDGKISSEAGRIDTVISDLSDETVNRTAAIQTEQTARVNADNALANDITTVQSSLNDQTASIQQLSQTSVQFGDDLTSIKAEYTLKLDVDGYVSGYSAINNGNSSSFLFRTDTFAIGSPGKESLSFVVDGDKVMMDGASIKHATITDAAISTLSVDKLIGNKAQFVEANINEGSITNAMIGNEIKSDGFVSGQQGWRIDKSGNAEFNNLTASGDIVGAYIRGSIIEGSLFIKESNNLLVATEADQGFGTTRFLAFPQDQPNTRSDARPSTNELKGVYSHEFILNSAIASADFNRDGVVFDDASQQNTYANFNRYRYYAISPKIKVELRDIQYATFDIDITVSGIDGVNKNTVFNHRYTHQGMSVARNEVIPHGFLRTTTKSYSSPGQSGSITKEGYAWIDFNGMSFAFKSPLYDSIEIKVRITRGGELFDLERVAYIFISDASDEGF